jgi:uncharacterized membrane protein YagU involved in acid resistance
MRAAETLLSSEALQGDLALSMNLAAGVKAVLVGGLIGGALDIVFAISFAAWNGTAPMRLLQIVASGAFGKAAFDGGMPMAAGGLALHFGLSFLWAAAFLALAGWKPALAGNPWIAGALFGVVVFFTMRLVVLPLSAFPYPVSFKPVATALDLLSHMLLFGVPIAWAARRAVVA